MLENIGISADNILSLLKHFKTYCRNVLEIEIIVGLVDIKGKLGEVCCHGRCTNIAIMLTIVASAATSALLVLNVSFGRVGMLE